jgi:hypothetical protein
VIAVVIVMLLLMSATVTAIVTPVKNPQGKPFQEVWNAIMDLQNQINNPTSSGGVTFVPCYRNGVNYIPDPNDPKWGDCEFTCPQGQYIWAVSWGSEGYSQNLVVALDGNQSSMTKPMWYYTSHFYWVECGPNNYI